MAKYDGIDFTPPQGAASAAQKAIDWKKEHGNAVKGGTKVGWTRASQLVSGKPMSPETVKRMYKFFQRHEKNKAVNPEYKSEPWRDNGYVAWLIWGGDAGKRWAETKWNQMEKADKKTASSPLRAQPDYGEKGSVNPYLNTAPTKLKRDLKNEKDPKKRKQMQTALNAWRTTVPGPFWKTKAAKRMIMMAKDILGV